MSKIDWKGELEAYHEDGRVVPVVLRDKGFGRMGPNPDGDGDYWIEDPIPFSACVGSDGSTGDDGWRIRNRQSILTATDRLERLEAFVARVAAVRDQVKEPVFPQMWASKDPAIYVPLSLLDEGRTLVAEIAPPVDPLEEAKQTLDVFLATYPNADDDDLVSDIPGEDLLRFRHLRHAFRALTNTPA